jgi:hypothetical protein
MSYFICGFKSENADFKDLERSLSELVPDHLREDTQRIESGSSSLVVYATKKAIQNVIIRDDKDGSWLAGIGTPLVSLKSEPLKLAFLSDFRADPVASLRDKIDGNFAVFCYDAPRNALTVATDFNNTTPVFYSVTPKGVFFSSHELALARFLSADADPFGFSQSIHLGVTWSSYTRFQNIKKMLPCEVAVVDGAKQLKNESYWQPDEERLWSGTFDEHIEKWISILKDSVWKFYECSDHQPVLSDFTAGEDTRLIISLCHALEIPYKANVTGLSTDTDLIIARRAAKHVGFDLIEREKRWITEEQLLAKASDINLYGDGYQEFLAGCVEFATDTADPLDDYSIVKYCGVPGGEAFRGAYYLRGKVFFPSKVSTIDYKFFTKLKYLLDYHPGLIRGDDGNFIPKIYNIVEQDLKCVKGVPAGIQVDHLIRVYQTCMTGLKYKNPLYLPFATNQMTRSVYGIPPRDKRGGRLSKACTEVLFPKLAFVKTQNKVPTIRKTMSRMPLFLPEHIQVVKRVSSGAVSRLLKWKQANKWYYSNDLNSYVFTTLLNSPPYSSWFSSTREMITGNLYDPAVADPILALAKTGVCRYVPILLRMISQELAFRWVHRVGIS